MVPGRSRPRPPGLPSPRGHSDCSPEIRRGLSSPSGLEALAPSCSKTWYLPRGSIGRGRRPGGREAASAVAGSVEYLELLRRGKGSAPSERLPRQGAAPRSAYATECQGADWRMSEQTMGALRIRAMRDRWRTFSPLTRPLRSLQYWYGERPRSLPSGNRTSRTRTSLSVGIL